MRDDIQQMAYRMQVEVQYKHSDAIIRAVQRFYGVVVASSVADRMAYSMEGGDAVLRDRKTGKIIILIRPYTTINHDCGVAFQVNYSTFDGKK